MNRKQFIFKGVAGIAMLSVAPKVIAQTQQERPAALKAELVKSFVRNGHYDLKAVQQMLIETPTLINACWDWGGGDFETALGGAAHMGNHEIAEFLIFKGARMDIFAAAMLGELAIVKSLITSFPNLLHAKGPHTITLLMHAQKGGDKSKEVVTYLKKMGLKK